MGKLKKIKAYRQLSKLRQELIHEINVFQDVVKAQGYTSEYILASRYALCATLDDIIANTSWGAQGQWEAQSLLQAFSNQETINQEKFFLILERIIKDPNVYIDVMEFMYICLSLGFKGNYRSTEFNQNQLEQIINALYKRIRKHRGEFSKTLAPFPIKPPALQQKMVKNMPVWLMVVLTACIVFSLFAGVRFMLDISSNQAYQDLTRTGKTPLYETHNEAVTR